MAELTGRKLGELDAAAAPKEPRGQGVPAARGKDPPPSQAEPVRCPNCTEPLAGRFCSLCGQDQQADRSLGALLAAFLDDVLDVDSRVWRSLRVLLTKPGHLSVDHRVGRRARYLRPARLYLIGSVLFFTAIALAPAGVVGVGVEAEVPGRLQTAFQRASEEPERLEDMFLGSFAWVMFALVPIFGLLLNGLWRGSGFLYVHHFVFALHYHAFAFLTQAAGFVVVHAGGALAVAALLTPHATNALYLYLAARRFYGEGRLRTLAKIAALGFVYIIVISAGMLATLWGLVLIGWGAA